MALTAAGRRIVLVLWIAAISLFLIALIRVSSAGTRAKDWVSDEYNYIMPSNSIDTGRLSIREHMLLSEASWARSVQKRHDMIKADWGNSSLMPLFPCVDSQTYRDSPYSIWDFTPASYGCPHEMERIGRLGDGGKWVCGMSKYVDFPEQRPCVIYSFGVQFESSFENEMLTRAQNCTIWAYDFSVVDFGSQLEDTNRDRAHFLQAGIAGKTDASKSPPFYSIADLMTQNGHDYIDILKMDIEFAEYEAMDGFNHAFPLEDDQELPVGQFLVELHLFNDFNAQDYLEWWGRLEARGLRATWTEPNLLAVTLNSDGNKNPIMAEYTMLNVRDNRNVIFDGNQV